MKTLPDMKKLQKLTAARLMARTAEYSACLDKENGLRDNLRALEKPNPQSFATENSPIAAHNANAEVLWRQWVDTRREVINTELARVLATKMVAHLALKKAFGKDQALQQLITTTSRRQQRQRTRG